MLVPWTAQAGQSGRTDYANGMERRSDEEQWPPLSWAFQSEDQLQQALLSRTLGCYSNVIIAKHHILKTLQSECMSSPPQRFHFAVTSFEVTQKKEKKEKKKQNPTHNHWGLGSQPHCQLTSLSPFPCTPNNCGAADTKCPLQPCGECLAFVAVFRLKLDDDLSCI